VAEDYDAVIVGAGTAGLTAGMYAARQGMKTVVLEQMMAGAGIINVEKIENYPGFPRGISGAELGPLIQEQAMNAGANIILEEATGVVLDEPYRVVTTAFGESYRAKAVIIAAGSNSKSLGIPGEEEMLGSGVSHCATCDGPLFHGEVVCVVGGGDSAADEAITLTEYVDRVVIFHRGERLDAQKVLQDRVFSNPKIEMVFNTQVESIVGDGLVTGVQVRNVITNLPERVSLAGVFVYVGLEPNSEVVRGLVKLDRAGHIPVGLWMDTEVPGVYAAGDIRQNSASQIASSAGDGATAAIGAFRYIAGRQWPR